MKLQMLKILLIILGCFTTISNGSNEYEMEEKIICDPQCSNGYDCVLKDGNQKKCELSSVLIAVIVIFSIIGVIVIVVGIVLAVLCYCAAFKQEKLSKFVIKHEQKQELKQQNKNKKMAKTKNGQVYPANYFDEMRRKRAEERGECELTGGSDEGVVAPTNNGNRNNEKSKKEMKDKSKSNMEIFPLATCTAPPSKKNPHVPAATVTSVPNVPNNDEKTV